MGLIKLLLIGTLTLLTTVAIAAGSSFPAQVLTNIYYSPSPMKADDKYFLVYEIFLSNFMKSPAKILSFSVENENKKNLFTMTDLKNAIVSPNEKNKDVLNFAPGESKKIFVWLSFANENDIPKNLSHHFSVASSFKNQPADFAMGTYQLAVDNKQPVIISSPLHGKNWLAGNGPSNTSDHRRTGLILDGKPYFAQRFAIDFVQVGKDGLTYSGDVHKNTSYHCYNQDVLAVADGTVVQTQDGLAENVPNSNKFAVEINEKNLPGNYIVLDLGNGNFAGYAHLIPGSLKVKVGDHVARNQVIAKLGNSGNSSEPHLHFQIINNKSFLKSEGIPYAFDHFYSHPSTLINDSTGSIGIKVTEENFKEYTNQLVLENALMNFD